jgi:hypothetical protein
MRRSGREETLERVPVTLNQSLGVMAGLVVLSRPSTSFSLKARKKDVDARDNPRIKSGDGHDGAGMIRSHRNTL